MFCMNKPYFCRIFFPRWWRHKCLKNTIDLLLFYGENVYRSSERALFNFVPYTTFIKLCPIQENKYRESQFHNYEPMFLQINLHVSHQFLISLEKPFTPTSSSPRTTLTKALGVSPIFFEWTETACPLVLVF